VGEMTNHLNTTWKVRGRIIDDKLTSDLSSETLNQHDSAIKYLLNQAEAPQTHIIVDMSEIHQQLPLFSLRKSSWLKHPHLGWVVVHGTNNKLTNFLMGSALKLSGVRHQFVKSGYEASEFLNEVDLTLPHVA
jgi:hypothetical protein